MRASFAVIGAVALLGAACGGGETEPQNHEAATSPDVGRARCATVPPQVVEAIGATLTVEGGGTLRNPWAVRSRDHDGVWFVSAEIDGPEREDDGDIATWAFLDPDLQEGEIVPVDDLAQELSQPDEPAQEQELTFVMGDDGVVESRGCVEQVGGEQG
jgi:hypothetical protein